MLCYSYQKRGLNFSPKDMQRSYHLDRIVQRLALDLLPLSFLIMVAGNIDMVTPPHTPATVILLGARLIRMVKSLRGDALRPAAHSLHSFVSWIFDKSE